MTAVAHGLDWPRLVRLLDLDDVEGHAERVRLLQERRAEEVAAIDLTAMLLANGRLDGMRGRLELLVEFRRADVASIEAALAGVGEPLGLPAGGDAE